MFYNAFINDPDWGVGSSISNKPNATPQNERLINGLRTALPRLGLKYNDTDLVAPSGSAIWIKPILLRGLSVSLRPDELQDENAKTDIQVDRSY